MRYIDVCSGISAPTMAWKSLGWEALCFAEIEAAPRAVLAHHYPNVPLRGDFTEIQGDEYGPVDLLVGGTPCQSFSIAGLRGGLGDDRGNLALEFARLADRARPRWVVWENVPGVLSSNGGRDFGSILGALGELGYGTAYRVLDAQYFGVPQRRRRVFVVGYLGDWRASAAVLFERHSLSGHPAPRREKGQSVAGVLTSRASGGGGGPGAGTDEACAGYLQPVTAPTLNAAFGSKLGLDNQHIDSGAGIFIAFAHQQGGNIDLHLSDDMGLTLQKSQTQAVAFSIMPMNSGKDYVARETDIAQPIMAGGPVGGNQGGDFIVPIDMRQASRGATMTNNRAEGSSGGAPGTGIGETGDPSPTVSTSHAPAVGTASTVRRLTPRECERLQGFPDDFTLVPHRGKPMADGPRYKMLGNSMAVPVLRWIGERIDAVDHLLSSNRSAAA